MIIEFAKGIFHLQEPEQRQVYTTLQYSSQCLYHTECISSCLIKWSVILITEVKKHQTYILGDHLGKPVIMVFLTSLRLVDLNLISTAC